MSDADDTHRSCPRCGAPSDGSPWCEECGLNLRVSRQPPDLSSHPTPPPLVAKPSRNTSRWLALLVATVLIALAAFAAAVLFLKRGGDGREDLPAAQTTIPAPLTTSNDLSPPEPATTESSVPVDTNIPLEAVENLLIEYESAYSNEDLAGLRNLFTDDLVRLPGTGATQDLHDALATYREQFSELAAPVYALSGVRAASNATEAEAVGKYTITDGGRTAGSGRIFFHIVLLDNSLYIDRLEVTPSG